MGLQCACRSPLTLWRPPATTCIDCLQFACIACSPSGFTDTGCTCQSWDQWTSKPSYWNGGNQLMFFKNTIFKTPYLPIIAMPPSSSIGGSKSPSSPITAANPTSLGCFVDNAAGRAIPNLASGTYNTPAACATYAVSQGANVFGMEAGSQCWWGTDIGAAMAQGESTGGCTQACAGDGSKICGGNNALSVFTTM